MCVVGCMTVVAARENLFIDFKLFVCLTPRSFLLLFALYFRRLLIFAYFSHFFRSIVIAFWSAARNLTYFSLARTLTYSTRFNSSKWPQCSNLIICELMSVWSVTIHIYFFFLQSVFWYNFCCKENYYSHRSKIARTAVYYYVRHTSNAGWFDVFNYVVDGVSNKERYQVNFLLRLELWTKDIFFVPRALIKPLHLASHCGSLVSAREKALNVTKSYSTE